MHICLHVCNIDGPVSHTNDLETCWDVLVDEFDIIILILSYSCLPLQITARGSNTIPQMHGCLP